MRPFRLTALAGISILLFALFVGCGSDDKSTTTPTISYGDNTDPDFVPVQEEINNLMIEIVDDMLDGFDNLYVIPGDTVNARADLMPSWLEPDPQGGPDTLIAVYQNNWYYVYATYTGDVFRTRLRDSIQYRQNGNPQQSPAGADYIHYIDNWEVISLNQDISHADYFGRNDYTITGLNTSLATINGLTGHNVEMVHIGTDTSLTYNYTFSATTSDIKVPKFVTGWASACPQSGTIDMNMTQEYDWTSGTASGQGSVAWTINVEFDYGTATVTADNGSITWKYTCEVCTVPGSDS